MNTAPGRTKLGIYAGMGDVKVSLWRPWVRMSRCLGIGTAGVGEELCNWPAEPYTKAANRPIAMVS